MKIAIVVMVKDEAEDILPWLCWYLDLGVDTILFFDDSSTDGTYEIAQEVGRLKDVRVERLPHSLDLYTVRQQMCYQHVLATYADEFDWIGFFDADEYLRLSDGECLVEFLDRSDLVGAIAINWCNYGSSGHVVKPSMPAFWAYDQHYKRDEMVNRHVKTFVRPKAWTGKWHNVHFFDVDYLLYDTSIGTTVNWSSIPGITGGDALWDRARVMHYQCRSMEHFVERVRKRPDIPAHPSLWVAYDHAEVTDDSPRLKYRSVALIMRSVVQDLIRRITVSFCNVIDPVQHSSKRPNRPSPRNDPPELRKLSMRDFHPELTQDKAFERSSKMSIVLIKTYFDVGIRLSTASGQVCGITSQDNSEVDPRVLALCIADLPEIVFLFVERVDQLIIIEQDPRLVDFLTYVLFPIGEKARFALRHPSTNFFLSSAPPVGQGKISASRYLVRDWEEFELITLDENEPIFSDQRVKIIKAFLEGDRDLDSFCSNYRQEDLSNLCSVFSVLMAIKGSDKLAKFHERLGALRRYVH